MGPREFHFTGTSGVKNISDEPSCPLSFLKSFLTDDLISNIVKFTSTNDVAVMKQSQVVKEKLNEADRSMYNLWVDIDNDDVWMYFCIIILMGIIKKPYVHMYWSTDCMLSTPIFSRLMRRDRFVQIRGMMRFTDPLNESSGSLHKISFLNHLNDKSSSNYIPGEYIAFDEFLSKWKGRLHFRQFIPSKREYGVKIYMCCGSNTGYLWRFIIYTGADTIYMQPNVKLPKSFGDYTDPSKVVLFLIDGLYNQGYKVVLDNLSTSPELLRALIENGTDSFGTVRRKQGLPSGFWEWKTPKSYLSSRPPISEFCGDIMAYRWNDCYKSKKTLFPCFLPSILGN